MGRSLPWESTLVQMPQFAAFAFHVVQQVQQGQGQPEEQHQDHNYHLNNNQIAHAHHNNNIQNEEAPEIPHQIHNPHNDEFENEMQVVNCGPVFEYCAHIRRYRLNLPLNNRKTADCRFTLLRLFNTYTDFSSDYSRVMKKHTIFMSNMADMILHTRGTITDAQEEGIRDAHCEFDRECTLKLLPRVKRIQSSCNYHIQSIERLVRSQSEGQLPRDTISPAKFDYLRLSAYPVLKDIKKYTENDVQTIHQHTQMIFPIISDMDSRSRRTKDQGQGQSQGQGQGHLTPDRECDLEVKNCLQDCDETGTRTTSHVQTEYTENFPLLSHEQMRQQPEAEDNGSDSED